MISLEKAEPKPKEEPVPQCTRTDKGHGHYYCDTCQQMGKESDLRNACPHKPPFNPEDYFYGPYA